MRGLLITLMLLAGALWTASVTADHHHVRGHVGKLKAGHGIDLFGVRGHIHRQRGNQVVVRGKFNRRFVGRRVFINGHLYGVNRLRGQRLFLNRFDHFSGRRFHGRRFVFPGLQFRGHGLAVGRIFHFRGASYQIMGFDRLGRPIVQRVVFFAPPVNY